MLSQPHHSLMRRCAPFALLALLALLPFLPALRAPFMPLDDAAYMLVPNVQSGPTWASLKWAWSGPHEAYYIPFTWMSFQLDAALWGPNPIGYHAHNLLLHALNTLLLFLILIRATGDRARSFVVAALWAVHPLRVESVAWITERKDMLAALFGFLGILGYVHWIQTRRALAITAVSLALAVSLLCKAMFPSMPLLLLMLDLWPLKRWHTRRDLPGLVAEKIPVFLVAAAGTYLTFLTQRSQVVIQLPLENRLANVPVNYVLMLRDCFLPLNLGVFYPMVPNRPPIDALLPLLALLAITAFAYRQWRRRGDPTLLAGWLFFLIAALPTIGLVQGGEQARADRYTLLPAVGLTTAVVFSIPRRWGDPLRRSLAAGLLIAALGVAAFLQCTLWQNNIALFQHTRDVTGPNYYVDAILGQLYADDNRDADADRFFTESLQFQANARAYVGLAGIYARHGQFAEAIGQLQPILAPGNAPAHVWDLLGQYLTRLHRYDDAFAAFTEAAKRDPGNPIYPGHLAAAKAMQARGE